LALSVRSLAAGHPNFAAGSFIDVTMIGPDLRMDRPGRYPGQITQQQHACACRVQAFDMGQQGGQVAFQRTQGEHVAGPQFQRGQHVALLGGGPGRQVLEPEPGLRHAYARLDAEAGPVERQVKVREAQDETGRGSHVTKG